METKTTEKDLIFQMEPRSIGTRIGCVLCGETTDKEAAVCVLKFNEQVDGYACQQCVKAHDVDERMKQHVVYLQGRTNYVRNMLGRVQLPTHEEWKKAEAVSNAEWEAAYNRG